MRKQNGFTLVELLVVVAVIAVLAVIAIPRYVNFTEEAKISTLQSNHRTLGFAYINYLATHDGAPPADITALYAYASNINGSSLDGSPAGATYQLHGDGTLISTLTGLRDTTQYPAGELILRYKP